MPRFSRDTALAISMNYLAHGFRHLDRPWFVAGTAAPDWLGVADRRVRIRTDVAERLAGTRTPEAELAAGVLQHLEDDRRFHRNAAFLEISAEMTAKLRETSNGRAGHRPSFAGHVATEILLDGELAAKRPWLLDRYFAALADLDAERVQESVNGIARGATDNLAPFVRRFREVEFLRDYSEDGSVLYRLNQVMRRVGLRELPGEVEAVLGAGRVKVRARLPELLPG